METTETILEHVRWTPETEISTWAGVPIVDIGFRLSFCGFHYARVWPVRSGCWHTTGQFGNEAFGSFEDAKRTLTDRLVHYIEAVERTTNSIGISFVDSSVRDYLEGKIADGWNTRR